MVSEMLCSPAHRHLETKAVMLSLFHRGQVCETVHRLPALKWSLNPCSCSQPNNVLKVWQELMHNVDTILKPGNTVHTKTGVIGTFSVLGFALLLDLSTNDQYCLSDCTLSISFISMLNVYVGVWHVKH